jgi:3-hydroxyisobutyrate dehydrogenase-like beta-hydroxyacid dehydrogenase
MSDTMANGKPRIAFIGFGEAGQAIAAGLHEADAAQMTAWDILFPDATGDSLRRAAEASGVRCAVSAADAVQEAAIVISAVTAASSQEAAQSVQAHLHGSPFFLDINSVSPGRKQDTAKMLGSAARYIDVAVVAPIHPARHQTPMLLAGPDSRTVAPKLAALGMRASIVGTEIGAAAAIKMVRSVMIKGIEALTLECFLAAARAGVIDDVAASMRNNYPGLDWAKIVPYNLERMAVHGERRAAEMEEVAETLRELGVEPLMTNATVKRQREMAQIGRQPTVRGVLDKDRVTMLGAISTATRDRH